MVLNNFRQFKGKNTINFGPGFNLIQGQNGTGKTGVLYAIYFGLYRGTSKGMVAHEDLISYGEEKLSVSIEFKHKGKIFRIFRSLDSENKESYKYEEWVEKDQRFIPLLTAKSKKTALKERVEKDTEIRQMEFERIVFAQQKEYYQIVRGDKDFMDNALHVLPLTFLEAAIHGLIPSKKELKSFQQLYSKSQEIIKQNEENIESQEKLKGDFGKKLKKLMGEKETLIENNKQYKDLKKIVKDHYTDKNELIRFSNDQKYAKKDISDLKENKTEFYHEHGSLEELNKKLDGLNNEFETIAEESTGLNEKVIEITDEIGQLTNELNGTKEKIDQITGIKGAPKCPLCNQDMSPEHVKKELSKYEKEQNDLDKKISKKKTKVEEIRQKIKGLNEKNEEKKKEIDKIKEKITEASAFDKNISEKQEKSKKAKQEYDALLKKFLPLFRETIEKYNKIMASDLRILEAPSVTTIEDTYKKMENSISSKLEDYEKDLAKLEEDITPIETQITGFDDIIKGYEDNIKKAREDIKDIKFKLFMEQKTKVLEEVMGDLIREFRERKVELLNTYTLEWYNKLVSTPTFRDIKIDKENYRISVLPIQTIVSEDEYKDIVKYASGGHETFIAIAERLALLEIFNTSFGIFDEITDNADSDNATQMITELAASGEYLEQVIAVTHFEVGREIAGNLIKVMGINDESGKYTGWSKIKN